MTNSVNSNVFDVEDPLLKIGYLSKIAILMIKQMLNRSPPLLGHSNFQESIVASGET